jgi:hypothetical protein
MEPWVWLVKPLVALAVFGLILLPVRLAVMRFLPDGRIKRLLLTRVDGK